MLAKFPGRCTRCQTPIRAGDEIVGAGSDATGWVHADCRNDFALPGLTTPQSTSNAPQGRTTSKGRVSKPAMVAPEGATFVYTDGACSGNPGPGGWAWAIDRDRFRVGLGTTEHQPADGDPRSPGSRHRSLWPARRRERLDLRRELLPRHVVGRVAQARLDHLGEEAVANRDLWEPLVLAVRERGDVAFQWVKGHSGHEMNDLVDQLAVAASLGQE